MGLLWTSGQTTGADRGPDQLQAATRWVALTHVVSHRHASPLCRRAAEAAVGVRGVGRPTQVMIQVMVELKAGVAVEPEVVLRVALQVALQVATPAVAQDGALEVEVPAGMCLMTPGIR